MVKIKVFKSTAVTFLLCAFGLSGMAQDISPEDDITSRSQLKFSVAGLIYDNLKLNHEGRKHLKSFPTLSGEFTISYYRHIVDDFGIILGAGVGVAPSNVYYNFKTPENSIFRNNDFYKHVDMFNNEYDGLLLLCPISVHKNFPFRGKSYSVEIGTKLNLQNIDPYYLPYRWEYSHTYIIGEDDEEVRLLDSFMETNGGILAMSYFIKIGLHRIMRKKQHTLEYRLVANWSPKKIRTGEFEFQNLGYVSRGTIHQNINFIGFEVSYGMTLSRRVKSDKNI